jgi:hypothetical protein
MIAFIRTMNGTVETPAPDGAAPEREDVALNAYSAVVTSVAERLLPSIASIRISRRLRDGRQAGGGGSGVVIRPAELQTQRYGEQAP